MNPPPPSLLPPPHIHFLTHTLTHTFSQKHPFTYLLFTHPRPLTYTHSLTHLLLLTHAHLLLLFYQRPSNSYPLTHFILRIHSLPHSLTHTLTSSLPHSITYSLLPLRTSASIKRAAVQVAEEEQEEVEEEEPELPPEFRVNNFANSRSTFLASLGLYNEAVDNNTLGQGAGAGVGVMPVVVAAPQKEIIYSVPLPAKATVGYLDTTGTQRYDHYFIIVCLLLYYSPPFLIFL